MAVGPDGARLAAPTAEELAALGEEQVGFLRGLEGILDRALSGHRPGESFVYGIYQELEPAVVDFLVRRYTAAGWGEVKLKEGLTGAFTLILIPGPPAAEPPAKP